MRNGVGAVFPHHDRFSGAHVSGTHVSHGHAAPQNFAAQSISAQSSSNFHRVADGPRANIARLFLDLRAALRVTPQQLAAHLQTAPSTLFALESGDFEQLPLWSETSRVVIAYTAMAGIDGRPVLAALADTLQRSSQVLQLAPPTYPSEATRSSAGDGLALSRSVPHEVAAPNRGDQSALLGPPHKQQNNRASRLIAVGSVLAQGAKHFPVGALKQVRNRPQRALYAVSLPLGLVLLLLNTSALEAAFSQVPRPVARVAQDVRSYFQVQFAPVREGLRWIEVEDPRSRRTDKLR